MQFWKEHAALRMTIMATMFILSMFLIIKGFQMTGQLGGLGLMVLGVILLVAVLAIYNSPFAESKGTGKTRKQETQK